MVFLFTLAKWIDACHSINVLSLLIIYSTKNSLREHFLKIPRQLLLFIMILLYLLVYFYSFIDLTIIVFCFVLNIISIQTRQVPNEEGIHVNLLWNSCLFGIISVYVHIINRLLS